MVAFRISFVFKKRKNLCTIKEILFLSFQSMSCKVHDGWRVGSVWTRGFFGGCGRRYTVLSTALLAVVCLAVLLADSRPVSLFASPKEKLAY
jgi:hypothetical protein